jgi:hypothetical protein
MMRPMIAAASSTVALSAVLALCLAACSSSPNNPPPHEAGVEAGADTAAEAGAPDAPDDVVGDGPIEGVLFDAGPNCPSSFTARAEGDSCFRVVTACDYPEGRCGCLVCEVDAQSFGYVWSCRRWDTGGPSCPARSPQPGSACDDPGRVCRYSAYCSISVGDDVECQPDGRWGAAEAKPACGYRMCPR